MNYKLECDCRLAEIMRSFVPLPGYDRQKLILVHLAAGEQVGMHEHREHSVLYYPEDAAAIMFEPKAGTMIYLPPGVRHSVPKVSEDRVSLAMLVDGE